MRVGARRIVAGLVVAAAFWSLPAAPASAAAATETFTGTVDAAGVSWVAHEFTVPSAGTVSAALDWNDPAADLNVFLRAPDGTFVAQSTSASAKPEVVSASGPAGAWRVGVKARTGRATYEVVVSYGDTAATASIAGRAFRDADADGVRDAGETQGVAGLTVTLRAGATPVASTTTSPTGQYSFTGVPSGTYRVAFTAPPDLVFSLANQGSDDTVDSDVDASGTTADIALGQGASVTGVDAGLHPPSAEGTVFTGTVDAAGTNWIAHPVQVPSAAELLATLDWSNARTDLNLFLYDPSGAQVALATSPNARPEVIRAAVSTVGTWRLGVKAKKGASDFTLTVQLTTGQPSLVKPAYARTIGGPGHAEMYPSGVDVDGTGVVYVADTGNDQVRAYDGSRALLWVTGTRGVRQLGSFDNPRDVAHLDGRVYVADTGFSRVQVLDAATGSALGEWTHRFGTIMGITSGVDAAGQPVLLVTVDNIHGVQVFSPTGVLQRTIGTGPGAADGQLRFPRDAATDAAGNVYVADYENDRVAVFTADGAWVRSWGTNGTAPGQFKRPYGLATDGAGAVYVADSNNGRIQKFSGGGTFLAAFGSRGDGATQFEHLRRVAVGAGEAPIVYGADLWGLKILPFSQAGAALDALGGSPPPAAGLNEPYGATVAGSDVFVADTTNQRFQRFSVGGTFELQWGTRGWGAGDPGENWPRDIAYSAASNTVWVADTKNFRALEFTPDGVHTGRAFGSKGSGPDQMNWPHALDDAGSDLVVADTYNHRVQRWNPATGKVVWTAAGFNFPKDLTVVGDTVFVADSLNARIVKLSVATGAVVATITSPELHRIEGIAVEPGGDVWVSDTSWNRLVELEQDGSVLQTYGVMGSAHGQFNAPAHLEIATAGTALELYVTDMWNDRVEIFRIGG